MLKYICTKDNIRTKSSVCPVCGDRTELEKSDIYWCENCKVPLYDKTCECCGSKGRRITTDIRPVFPEERLLLEILLDKEIGTYDNSSVWNCAGNKYLIDGERIKFSVKDLKEKDADKVREQYEKFADAISYDSFNQYMDKFVSANKSIKEYGGALPSEMINAFTGVEGCLKEIRFLVSAQNNFEIIKHAINKTDEGFKDFIYNNDVNNEIIEQSYKIPCFESMFTEKDYKEIVAEGGFPMLPLTAYSLLNISEKVAQNERSIFTFIANEEKGTVITAIEEGREDLIAVDMVYDYFENLFRDNVSLTNIHNEWLKADYAITKAESLAEEKVREAFDTSPKSEYKYNQNMELFNSYARGGIEYLYEKLVVRPSNLDDEEFTDARMSNIMALFNDDMQEI